MLYNPFSIISIIAIKKLMFHLLQEIKNRSKEYHELRYVHIQYVQIYIM